MEGLFRSLYWISEKGMTTTEVQSVVENFVLKLLGLKTKINFFYKQLPLNENDNNFEGKSNDINSQKIVTRCSLLFFNYDNVYILGYVCGVFHYLKYYNQNLDEYQVLPCPYLGYFENYHDETFIK